MNQDLAVINTEVCDKAKKLKQNLEISFLEFGKIMAYVRDNHCYEPNYESFADYLAVEIKMSESVIKKLIMIYNKFVVEFGIEQPRLAKVGWSVLAETLPVVNELTAEDWVHKAEVLTQSDLRREVKEARTGILMKDCKHENSEIISFKICPTCGVRERVYGSQ